jgi:probable HAF family extracellular repeat protein
MGKQARERLSKLSWLTGLWSWANGCSLTNVATSGVVVLLRRHFLGRARFSGTCGRLALAIVLAICLLNVPPARAFGLANPGAVAITDLGPLGPEGQVSDINEQGHVVGTTRLGSCARGIVWRQSSFGTAVPLDNSADCVMSASAINEAGEIAVNLGTSAGRLQTDGVLDIGVLPQYSTIQATDINDRGQVVGVLQGTYRRAFRFFDDIGLHGLGTLGGAESGAMAIGPFGQVVGWAQTTHSPQGDPWNPGHAFLFTDLHSMEDLNDRLPGDSGWELHTASATDGAYIVGFGHNQGQVRAYRLLDRQVVDIGVLPGATASYALSVNGFGQVVGAAVYEDSRKRAFIYDDQSGIVDLNAMVDAQLGWELLEATAINNRGEIVGQGFRGGELHGFKLTFPVPADDPASVLVAENPLGDAATEAPQALPGSAASDSSVSQTEQTLPTQLEVQPQAHTASTGWQPLPGRGARAIHQPGVVNFEGRIYVFGIDSPQRVWMQVFDPVADRWLFPEELPDFSDGLLTARPITGPYLAASPDRLFLFIQAGDRILMRTKQLGGRPLEQWDTWQGVASKVPRQKTITAVHISGRLFLLRSDEYWGEVREGEEVRWQRQKGFGFLGAVPLLPESGSATSSAYVFRFRKVKTPLRDQDGLKRYVRYQTSGLPAPTTGGCIIDSGNGFGAGITGYQYMNQEGQKEFVAFYPDEGGELFAVMEGDDTFGLGDGGGRLCSTWAGAANLYLPTRGGPPAVAPLLGTEAALLFSRNRADIDSGRIYFKLFRADQDIVPEINTRFALRGRTIASGEFTIRGVRQLIPGLGGPCAPEVAVAIHGWTNPPDEGQDKFQRARRGLRHLGYPHPVIGFTWAADQNSLHDLFGFDDGKKEADRSALGFALALQAMKHACPEMKIRLMAHSLGGRVLYQILRKFDTAPELVPWRQAGHKVTSVHFLAAAVDNEIPMTNDDAGRAIERQATWVFNYFSDEDDILEFAFSGAEADNALGETGIENHQYAPYNYTDRDVEKEMGNKHFDYWAVINFNGLVRQIRAMDDVLRDFAKPGWRAVSGEQFSLNSPSATVSLNVQIPRGPLEPPIPRLKFAVMLFTRSIDDTLNFNIMDTAENWVGWRPIPGLLQVSSAPAAITIGKPLCTVVFFRPPDGDVAYVADCGGGWKNAVIRVTDEQRVTSAPAVAIMTDSLGQTQLVWLVTRGPDGRIFENILTPRLGKQGILEFVGSRWTAIPGKMRTTSSPAAVVFGQSTIINRAPPRRNLFIKGDDGLIYQNHFGLTWDGWKPVQADNTPSTLDGPAVVAYRNRLYLYTTERETLRVRQTILRFSANPYSRWNPWYEVFGGGQTPRRETGVSFNGRLYLFIQGLDEHVYFNRLYD